VLWQVGVWSVTVPFVALTLASRAIDPEGELGLRLVRQWWSPAMVALAGCSLGVSGDAQRLADGQPRIFIANHQSSFDIPVCFMAVPVNLRMLAKREIYDNPIIGPFLRAFNFPPVDRQHRDAAFRSFDQAAAQIRHGHDVMIFPEGTRSADGDIGPFKKGAFVLAIKAGVPITPIGLAGSYEALPRADKVLRPGRIHVRIGDDLDTTGLVLDDRHALLERGRIAVIEAANEAARQRTAFLSA